MKYMKNLFGEPNKQLKEKSRTHIYIRELEKKVTQLQQQLETMREEHETSIQELQFTQSQNNSEPPLVENSLVSDDSETIFSDETISLNDEENYILLEKPKPTRHTAMEVLEREAVQEVYTNRREIIKRKIEEELRKKELSAKELKILFVDDHQYCSKATFYRYLESLRKEHRIDSIKINGKEYLCSIPSQEKYSL